MANFSDEPHPERNNWELFDDFFTMITLGEIGGTLKWSAVYLLTYSPMMVMINDIFGGLKPTEYNGRKEQFRVASSHLHEEEMSIWILCIMG